MTRLLPSSLLLAALTGVAAAQYLPPLGLSVALRGVKDAPPWGVATISLPQTPPLRTVFSGAPYSAESGSTTESLVGIVKTYRDSQGRMRWDRTLGGGAMGGLPIVIIQDPLVGYLYLLDPQRKLAYRIPFQSAEPRPMPMMPVSRERRHRVGPDGVDVTTEYLGTRVFGSVEAEGERQTMILPEGYQGNDRPTTQINETWRSARLGLTLKTVTTQYGSERVAELQNVSAVEPPLSVFLVPADYLVQEPPLPFTIELGIRPEGAPDIAPFNPTLPPPQPRP